MRGCLLYLVLSPVLFIVLGWPWAAFHSVPVLFIWWGVVVAARFCCWPRRRARRYQGS